jgi:5-formyltetrahydrofolate cyclo-ligase
MSKSALRRQMLALRPSLQSAHPSAAGDVARNFNAHVPLDPIQDCVAVYQASGGEIDSDDLVALLRARNVPLALPVTHENGPLSFRVYAEDTFLVPDAAGMLAPDENAPACRPSVIILPLLAFDATGARLGRGGGHYDRTLAGLRKKSHLRAIGLAFDEQMVEKCPVEPHDAPLDMVVTPMRAITCGEGECL